MAENRAACFVLSAFQDILDSQSNDVMGIGQLTAIPKFEPRCVLDLCDAAKQVFMDRPMLLHKAETVYIVGDLHGSFHDLVRLLRTLDYRHNKFLFLGDYVDRGHFSLEVICLLFALMVTRPDDFTLLRGNHEFRDVCEKYGFKQETLNVYGEDTVFRAFCDVFEYMPVACLLNDAHFCVHGGISQHLKSLNEISRIPRPLKNGSGSPFVMDLLWADPCEAIPDYCESSRSEDYSNFGSSAFRHFLADMGIRTVVRAHEYTAAGVKLQFRSLLTVFSASSYSGHGSNACGVVHYNLEMDDFTFRVFEALPRMQRKEALFFTPKYEIQQSPKKTVFNVHCWNMIGQHRSTALIPKSIMPSASARTLDKKGENKSTTSCPYLDIRSPPRRSTIVGMKSFMTCRRTAKTLSGSLSDL